MNFHPPLPPVAILSRVMPHTYKCTHTYKCSYNSSLCFTYLITWGTHSCLLQWVPFIYTVCCCPGNPGITLIRFVSSWKILTTYILLFFSLTSFSLFLRSCFSLCSRIRSACENERWCSPVHDQMIEMVPFGTFVYFQKVHFSHKPVLRLLFNQFTL